MSAPFPPFPLTLFPDGTWKTSQTPVVLRDPLKRPGLPESIWNLPISKTAVLTDPVLRKATDMAQFVDTDVLILRPTAPLTAILEMLEYRSDGTGEDGWGPSTRNVGKPGVVVYSAPIPLSFSYVGAHQGSPDGDTPNASAAILAADGHTLIQTQPFCRWPPLNPPTSIYRFPVEDIRGLMETGSHGGSLLSAIGGCIRLGEWVPGGRIPHAVKLNLDSANFSQAAGGFRWPARKADRPGGAGYGGSIPACRMGSLLTLPTDALPAIETSLRTEEVKILARALYYYGAYIVDSAGWSVYGTIIERSPDGSVRDEFARAWGHPIDEGANTGSDYATDMHALFTALRVVDSWDSATWSRVAASGGKEGAGGGYPRTPWAAPLA